MRFSILAPGSLGSAAQPSVTQAPDDGRIEAVDNAVVSPERRRTLTR